MLIFYPASTRALIIDGIPAKYNEWTQVVGVTAIDTFQGLRERIVCTGVLIHPRVVLTAAHCILPETKSIYLGTGSEGGEVKGQHEIVRIERYPGWTGYTEYSASYDYAFIQLKESVNGVTPVRIFKGDHREQKNLTVIGYGARDTKYLFTGEKYFKEMPFAVNERLKTIFLGSVLLPGDSGGPGIVNSGYGPELIGINSRIIKKTSILEIVDDNVICWIEERTSLSLEQTQKANCNQWNLKRKNFLSKFKKTNISDAINRDLLMKIKSSPVLLTFRRGLAKMKVSLSVDDDSFKLKLQSGLTCSGKLELMQAGPFYPALKGVCLNQESYFELVSLSNGRLFLSGSKKAWSLE